MSGNASSSVETKLVELVPDVKGTIIPQKRALNGNASVVNENSRAVMDEFLDAFNKAEAARTNREQPVLKALIVLTVIQIVAFNVIIGGAGIYVFRLNSLEGISLYFDILKYYIGATVVELIGMFAFIVKSTFSSSHSKMMEILLNKDENK